MKNITLISGGTGSFNLRQGLTKYPVKLAAIFPTTDDGGSSGCLRRDLKMIAPGDARQIIITFSPKEKIGRDILAYRFAEGDLKGHNFGNILLAALTKTTGNFETALREVSKLFNIKEEIIPVTTKPTILKAQLENGRVIIGEHNIDEPKHSGKLKIKKLYLAQTALVNPRAKRAIQKANLIILGPGDLYTSTLPNLLARGIISAIKKSRAKKVFITNIMTKWGQTNGFVAGDLVKELEKYLGQGVLDYIIVNTKKPTSQILKYHVRQKSTFIEPDLQGLEKKYQIIKGDFLAAKIYQKSKSDVLTRSLLRHNSAKIARQIIKIN